VNLSINESETIGNVPVLTSFHGKENNENDVTHLFSGIQVIQLEKNKKELQVERLKLKLSNKFNTDLG